MKRGNSNLLPVVCAALFVLGNQASIAADLDARIETHRKQGLPFDLNELNKWHGYPIEGPNAANAYSEALDLLSKHSPGENHFSFLLRTVELPRSGPLSPELRQTINNFVLINQKALKRLHEAALVKECRFPTDWRTGWDTFHRQTTGPFRGSQILNLEALKRAEDGEIQAALESVEAAIAAANALASETEVSAQETRLHQLGESYLILERILNRAKPTTALLDRIGKIPSAGSSANYAWGWPFSNSAPRRYWPTARMRNRPSWKSPPLSCQIPGPLETRSPITDRSDARFHRCVEPPEPKEA
jgi:hypothetical protein